MTHDEAKARVQEIKDIADDDYEVAHSLEDSLYKDFILVVSKSNHPLSWTAKGVLKARDVGFPRFCG